MPSLGAGAVEDGEVRSRIVQYLTLQNSTVFKREMEHVAARRVGHRIEPAAQASHLALLLCPLFVPVTLGPGQTQEFVSEYLLLADVPSDAKQFAVTYRFPVAPPEAR